MQNIIQSFKNIHHFLVNQTIYPILLSTVFALALFFCIYQSDMESIFSLAAIIIQPLGANFIQSTTRSPLGDYFSRVFVVVVLSQRTLSHHRFLALEGSTRHSYLV